MDLEMWQRQESGRVSEAKEAAPVRTNSHQVSAKTSPTPYRNNDGLPPRERDTDEFKCTAMLFYELHK